MPKAPHPVKITDHRDRIMNQQFQAHPMDWRHASAAYPLVYLHDASITTDQWLRFVQNRCRPASDRTGLVAIRDRRDIVHALFGYRIDSDLHIRNRLCITDLIVAHLPGSQIDAAIIASAENVSAQFDCQIITIEQPFQFATKPRCPTAEVLKKRINPAIGRHRQT
jgi:hypothetical protein